MKKYIAILFSLVALSVYAQSYNSSYLSVHQDETLNRLVYANKYAEPQVGGDAVSAPGYRVQVFSSNHPQNGKKLAVDWENKLKQQYAEHVYVTYAAPFWRVRIGDFTDYYEALRYSRQLKADFPESETDIYVIKEELVKPYYFK